MEGRFNGIHAFDKSNPGPVMDGPPPTNALGLLLEVPHGVLPVIQAPGAFHLANEHGTGCKAHL